MAAMSLLLLPSQTTDSANFLVALAITLIIAGPRVHHEAPGLTGNMVMPWCRFPTHHQGRELGSGDVVYADVVELHFKAAQIDCNQAIEIDPGT